MSHRLRVILLSLTAIGFTLFNAFTHYDQGSLIYDEGDYYQAIRNGFWNNWMDADDVPTIEFIETGIKAVRGEIARSEMSKMIRSRGSSAFYRHYHPPFAFYHPMITKAIAPDMPPENQLRFGTFGLIILWILILAALSLKEESLFTPWFVLIPASANWVASACGFNMHVPFGLALTTMAIAWYAYEGDRSKVWIKRVSLFFLAVALCSVEYSLFLNGMLFLWGIFTLWKKRKEWKAHLKVRFVDLAWLVGFMLVIWPAGVLKLGLLKSYALQAYIALFRLDSNVDGFTTFREMIEWKWTGSPIEMLLLVGIVVGIIWGWQKVLKRGSLFVSLGVVLAIIYTQLNPALVLRWYLFPVFSVAFAFYLHILSERAGFSHARESAIAFLTACTLFAVTQLEIKLPSYTKAREVRDAVRTLSGADSAMPIITVQGMAPPLGAYFPERQVRGFHPEDFKKGDMVDSLNAWMPDHILVIPGDVSVESENGIKVEDLVIIGSGGK